VRDRPTIENETMQEMVVVVREWLGEGRSDDWTGDISIENLLNQVLQIYFRKLVGTF
jgi:hypothetical protein